MFYDLYCELCSDKGITASGAAAAIGFNRATVTTWKNTGKAPKGDLLSKIAKYFEVPVDFLLQRPPFDYWDEINADRRSFIAAANLDDELLKLVWNLNPLDPYAIPLKDFVSFMSIEFLSAVPDGAGGWNIKVRAGTKKAPVPGSGDRHQVSDNEIKFALFGDAEIDDEVLDEVKRFAQFAREQRRQKEQQTSD